MQDEEQLQNLNRTIVRLGDTLGKPVCATGDVHFLEPQDAVYREILMSGKGFDDAQFQAPLYYRSTEEIAARAHAKRGARHLVWRATRREAREPGGSPRRGRDG